jgi:hypothetical protein
MSEISVRFVAPILDAMANAAPFPVEHRRKVPIIGAKEPTEASGDTSHTVRVATSDELRGAYEEIYI